jgi:hypothetical protein
MKKMSINVNILDITITVIFLRQHVLFVIQDVQNMLGYIYITYSGGLNYE